MMIRGTGRQHEQPEVTAKGCGGMTIPDSDTGGPSSARRPYWQNLAVPGAIICGAATVVLGFAHVHSDSHPYKVGYLGGLGYGTAGLACLLLLRGMATDDRGSRTPRRRWTTAAHFAGLLLTLFGVGLLVTGTHDAGFGA
jgi:hypothetical protein